MKEMGGVKVLAAGQCLVVVVVVLVVDRSEEKKRKSVPHSTRSTDGVNKRALYY